MRVCESALVQPDRVRVGCMFDVAQRDYICHVPCASRSTTAVATSTLPMYGHIDWFSEAMELLLVPVASAFELVGWPQELDGSSIARRRPSRVMAKVLKRTRQRHDLDLNIFVGAWRQRIGSKSLMAHTGSDSPTSRRLCGKSSRKKSCPMCLTTDLS